MKILNRIFTLILAVCCIQTASAQVCVSPLQTIIYDTTFLGTGNAVTPMSFPKFDPMSGTLMTVDIQTTITLKYSFQLENTDVVPINNYRVRVNREDEISGPALMAPIYNSQLRTYGPYALAAGDATPGAGLDFIARGPLYVMNHTLITQPVYNTADYLGVGNVNFDYTTTTYSFVTGGVNNFFTGTAQDSVNVKVIYTYCPTWFLKADLQSFSAIKLNESSVDIQWAAENEDPNRTYELEKSFDGKSYETIATKLSSPNGNGVGQYRVPYYLQSNDHHQRKIIFRLKQKDKDGTIKYSMIRIVDFKASETSGMKVYPNPAKLNSQLVFSNTTRGHWKVELINRAGARVKQYHFNNALGGKIDGLDLIPKGIYIIIATEQKTGEVMRQQLVVQ
jgi:hypothetical protein